MVHALKVALTVALLEILVEALVELLLIEAQVKYLCMKVMSSVSSW